jgi:hypothetical protein
LFAAADSDHVLGTGNIFYLFSMCFSVLNAGGTMQNIMKWGLSLWDAAAVAGS